MHIIRIIMMDRITHYASRIIRVWMSLFIAVFLASCTDSGSDSIKAGFESGLYHTVVAFGDSIVKGYQQPEGWPEILGRELTLRYPGVSVANAGVSGDTAARGLARLERDVLSLKPDLVLISFGLNDMKNQVPMDRFTTGLKSIVDRLEETGSDVVLLTTTRLQKGAGMVARFSPDGYNEGIRKVAEERGVLLIDVYREFKGLNTPEYLMDVAHPNLMGYKKISEIVLEGLVGN